jgi:hypothetical protein
VVAITPAQLGYLREGIDWRNPLDTWRPDEGDALTHVADFGPRITSIVMQLHSWRGHWINFPTMWMGSKKS